MREIKLSLRHATGMAADPDPGQQSFESFYVANSDEIYRTLAVILRDTAAAREATDEAMTRAFVKWRKVRRYDNPGGWVYRVALNWSRTQMRKRRREVLTEPPDREGEASSGRLDPDMYDAIAALSEDHRSVIVLKYLAGFSQGDIAQIVGVPVGTVKSRLSRALETLKEQIDDEYRYENP
jgi:RNA polymerase sigma-70 factor (ECF subfamily)